MTKATIVECSITSNDTKSGTKGNSEGIVSVTIPTNIDNNVVEINSSIINSNNGSPTNQSARKIKDSRPIMTFYSI